MTKAFNHARGETERRTRIDRMKSNAYAMILDCYRSGQISERQWQEHLKDEVFAAWVRARAVKPE